MANDLFDTSILDDDKTNLESGLNVAPEGVADTGNNLGWGTVVPSAVGKFFYDFAKMGGDMVDFFAGREEATFEDWWDLEERTTGRKRGVGTKITGEILTLIGGAKAISKGGQILANSDKLGKYTDFFTKFRKTQDMGKAAKMAHTAFEAAASDFIWGSTGTQNLSGMLEEIAPGVMPDAVRFLAHDVNDSAFEKRLKNAGEGMALGVMSDFAIGFLGASMRWLKGEAKVIESQFGKPVAHSFLEEATGIPKEEFGRGLSDMLATSDDVIRAGDEEFFDQVVQKALNVTGRNVDDIGESAIKTTPEESINVLKDSKSLSEDLADLMLNTEKFNSANPAHFKQLLASVQKNLGQRVDEFRGRGESFSQWLKETSDGAFTEDQAKAVISKFGQDLEGATASVIMGKALVLKATRQVDEFFEAVGRNIEDLTDDELVSAIALVDEVIETSAQVSRISTGLGKGLAAHKVAVGESSVLSKLDELVDAKDAKLVEEGHEVLRSIMKGADKKKIIGVLKDVKSGKNISKIAEDASKKKGIIDVIKEIRQTSLLSGLATHATNIFGSLAMIGYRSLQKFVQASIDAPSRIFGSSSGDVVKFKESWSYLKGGFDFSQNARQLINNIDNEFAKDPLVTRRNIANFLDERNIPANSPVMYMAKGLGLMGELSHKVSFGAMKATDNFFSNRAFMAESSSIIARMTDNADDVARITESLRKKMDDPSIIFRDGDMNKTIDEIIARSMSAAKEVTFQTELKGGFKTLQGWLNSDNTAAKLMSTFPLPFYRTPLNIAKTALETIPGLNLVLPSMREALSNKLGHRAMREAQAKMAIGVTVYSATASLVLEGKLTGKHPQSRRNNLIEGGFPENSIKLGDSWYNYTRLDPLGMLLGLTADSVTLGDNEGTSGLLLALSNNMISKTYMRGLKELLDVASRPDRNLTHWSINQTRSLANPLSGLQRTLTHVGEIVFTGDGPTQKAIPKDIKSVSDFFDSLWKDNVWVNSQLGTRVNLLGEEKNQKDFTATDKIIDLLGVRVSKTEPSKAMSEIARLQAKDHTVATSGSTLGKIEGVQMTFEEDQWYRKIRNDGFNLKDKLTEVIESEDYKQLNDKQRARILKNIIDRVKDQSKSMLIRSSSALRDDIDKMKKRNLRLMLKSPTGDVYNDYLVDQQDIEANPLRRQFQ